jgi:hypothetical protein
LVFQFEALTSEDFDRLISLEETLEKAMPGGSKLDGHDFGGDEFNIFLHTNNPRALFQQVCEVLETAHPGLLFSAGFRGFGEEYYTVLWPPSSTEFSVA